MKIGGWTYHFYKRRKGKNLMKKYQFWMMQKMSEFVKMNKEEDIARMLAGSLTLDRLIKLKEAIEKGCEIEADCAKNATMTKNT